MRQPESGIQRVKGVLRGGILRPLPIQRPLHGKRGRYRRGADAVGAGGRLAGRAGAECATARRRARPPHARPLPPAPSHAHLPRARLRRTRLKRTGPRGPFSSTQECTWRFRRTAWSFTPEALYLFSRLSHK